LSKSNKTSKLLVSNLFMWKEGESLLFILYFATKLFFILYYQLIDKLKLNN
jgi:hypothetical protein